MPENKNSWYDNWKFKLFYIFFVSRDVSSPEERKQKTEKAFFLLTLAIHCLALFAIALAILAIAVIYPLTNRLPPQVDLEDGSILVLYICALFYLPLGALWPKILNWKKWSSNPGIGLYLNHGPRMIIFFIPAFLGYYLGIGGVGWNVILPMFLISIILLVVIFPTKNKWEKWKDRD